MSETQSHDSVTPTTSASPGELLSRQREDKGISLTEAARALNLRPAVIDGLERDQYDEIPVPTYRRGYLRTYAKYLGMDDRQVLDAYQARHGSVEPERKLAPVAVTRPPSRVGAWLFKLVTLIIIAALIGLTVMWWQSRGGNEPPGMGSSPTMEEESPTPSVAPETGAPTTPPTTSAPANAPTPPPEAGEADEAMEGIDAQSTPPIVQDPDALANAQDTAAADEEAASDDDANEESAASTGANTLELTFNEQSWTEIFDAGNQRVFVGLQAPGTTASVEGQPPFRLTVGNASGVELIYQGETVDLAARAGANNVARFTLGE